MLFIHNTVSLCDHCYRHVPAVVYEHDNKILMKKRCPKHGDIDSVVEIDTEFYYGLKHQKTHDFLVHGVLFEASDRCQLDCPHCYHLPDNKSQDRSLKEIIYQLRQFPKDCIPMLAGAEATLRPDFVELCAKIDKLGFRWFEVLTNGLRFADMDFATDCFNAGLRLVNFGLNHPSYQGEKVHAKQLRALDNIIKAGTAVGYVGYTIEDYDHLPFILDEIKSINHEKIRHYRIRCGSFIGRSSDQQRGYLSVLVQKIKEHLGSEVVSFYAPDDNPYHVLLKWNNILLRVIQWPDVTNIDMEELNTGPWCQFYDGPITNFVHQVITRDAYKNKGLSKLDLPPVKYQYQPCEEKTHWKSNWTGPVPFDTFKFEWPSDQPQPVKPYFRIHSQ